MKGLGLGSKNPGLMMRCIVFNFGASRFWGLLVETLDSAPPEP